MGALKPASTFGRRLVTGALWALLAGSLAFWATRLRGAAPLPPPPPAAPPPLRADPQRLRSLLGASAARPSEARVVRPRLVLHGVVGDQGDGRIALIAIDGQPARPFMVGRQVVEGYTLRSVDPHQVVLAAPGDGEWRLAMPEPRAAGKTRTPDPPGPPPRDQGD